MAASTISAPCQQKKAAHSLSLAVDATGLGEVAEDAELNPENRSSSFCLGKVAHMHDAEAGRELGFRNSQDRVRKAVWRRTRMALHSFFREAMETLLPLYCIHTIFEMDQFPILLCFAAA